MHSMKLCAMLTFCETANCSTIGQELEFGSIINNDTINDLILIDVHDQPSPMVLRDNVGDTTFHLLGSKQIEYVHKETTIAQDLVVSTNNAKKKTASMGCPLSYSVCQNKINTKFVSLDEEQALPKNTLVTKM